MYPVSFSNQEFNTMYNELNCDDSYTVRAWLRNQFRCTLDEFLTHDTIPDSSEISSGEFFKTNKFKSYCIIIAHALGLDRQTLNISQFKENCKEWIRELVRKDTRPRRKPNLVYVGTPPEPEPISETGNEFFNW